MNVFYANTAARTTALFDLGIRGILTDCPDIAIAATGARGLRA